MKTLTELVRIVVEMQEKIQTLERRVDHLVNHQEVMDDLDQIEEYLIEEINRNDL